MPLWRKRHHEPGGRGDVALLSRRVTRFRHLLRRYAAFLDLQDDAADKQGGDYVLDRQYVVALADSIGELADAVVFDLNVLTGQRHLDFYPSSETMRSAARELLAAPVPAAASPPPEVDARGAPVRRVSPEELAAAIGRHEVAFRQAGSVACRGVAAGRVLNLRESPDAPPRDGAVVVADTIGADGALAPRLKRAAALLLDEGSAASPVASLVRELRIPAIVGLHEASVRLHGDATVTVDADENTVYIGEVKELLAYYETERIGNEEEAEYRLLRAVRRAAFPLTCAGAAVDLSACRTLHDLVFLGHMLAGEAIAALATTFAPEIGTTVAADTRVRVVDVIGHDEVVAQPAQRTGGPSRPLEALVAGLRDGSGVASRPQVGGVDASGFAAVKEEQALVVIPASSGFDLVDAVACVSRALNHVYCRFAPAFAAATGDDARAVVAAGVLTRLGFAGVSTGRGATGWLRGRPAVEIEEKLGAVGRLIGRLGRLNADEIARHGADETAERLARECG